MMLMSKQNLHSPWFTTYGLPRQQQARIFFFPYSGSGTSGFYQWSKFFRHSRIDFTGIQLPGRENRLREKPISDLSILLEKLLPAITPLLDKPFVFFGHSLGALIAFELCRALRRQDWPLPQHLFVSGFRSPELSNPNKNLHHLATPAFIEGIREYGGTSEEVLANGELMDFLLPVLRADFSLHETYEYQGEHAFSCPITALVGTEDPFVRPEHMFNWRYQTHENFQQIQYQGKHFFLHEHMVSISQRLQQSLMD